MSSFGLAAALLLAIDPRASRVDVSGAVSVELRGGRAPVVPTESPTGSFLSIITPDFDVNARSRRGGSFTLGYSPRVQYRVPNRIDLDRPILLHQAYAGYDKELTARWTLGANLGGSVGETDYTGLTIALGDQAQTPETAIVRFAIASADLRLDGRLTRRHTLVIEPRAGYRAPLDPPPEDDADDDGLGALPEQLTVDLGLGLETRLSLIDQIHLLLRPGVVDYNGEVTFADSDNRVRWIRRLRPSLTAQVDAGIFGAARVRGGSSNFQVFPVGGASVSGGLRRRANYNVDGSLGLDFSGFFDRVTERVDPRARLTATLTFNIPPRWSAGATLGAFTNVTGSPRDPSATGDTVPESQIQFTTPVTYQIDDRQQFEFGTILSVRAPHLRADDLEFTQLETWFYVAYRVGGGTARGGDEVGGGGGGSIGTGTRGVDAAGGGRR